MSITITIPTHLEPLILNKAVAAGKPVEEITIGLIEQGLQPQRLEMTFNEIPAPFHKEVAATQISALNEQHNKKNPQRNEAMLAALQRSAERLKDMPVRGSTEETLKMIRRARAGEMWGYEPTDADTE